MLQSVIDLESGLGLESRTREGRKERTGGRRNGVKRKTEEGRRKDGLGGNVYDKKRKKEKRKMVKAVGEGSGAWRGRALPSPLVKKVFTIFTFGISALGLKLFSCFPC